MPQGDKSAYTDKQKRKARHIEDSYREQGVPEKEAEARAWATVNKQDGGGKKSGSGRKRPAAMARKDEMISEKFHREAAPRKTTPASARETAATKTRGELKPSARDARPESMPPGKRTQPK